MACPTFTRSRSQVAIALLVHSLPPLTPSIIACVMFLIVIIVRKPSIKKTEGSRRRDYFEAFSFTFSELGHSRRVQLHQISFRSISSIPERDLHWVVVGFRIHLQPQQIIDELGVLVLRLKFFDHVCRLKNVLKFTHRRHRRQQHKQQQNLHFTFLQTTCLWDVQKVSTAYRAITSIASRLPNRKSFDKSQQPLSNPKVGYDNASCTWRINVNGSASRNRSVAWNNRTLIGGHNGKIENFDGNIFYLFLPVIHVHALALARSSRASLLTAEAKSRSHCQ